MEQSVPKRRHIKFKRRRITQKERIQQSQNDENFKSRLATQLAKHKKLKIKGQ
jgi:hypothetical protein